MKNIVYSGDNAEYILRNMLERVSKGKANKPVKILNTIDITKGGLSLDKEYRELKDKLAKQRLLMDFEEKSKGCQYRGVKPIKTAEKQQEKQIVSLLVKTTDFEVKDFLELTKREKRRYIQRTQRLDAKMFWYNHEYLKAIEVYIKSII